MTPDMIGTNYHTVDSKGRMIVPTDLRDGLTSSFIMSPGTYGKCIYMHSQAEWVNYLDRIKHMDPQKLDIPWTLRFLRSSAMNCSIDSQGRTVIPEALRNKYKIGKNIVIVGAGERAEIWTQAEWESAGFGSDEAFEKMENMMSGIHDCCI